MGDFVGGTVVSAVMAHLEESASLLDQDQLAQEQRRFEAWQRSERFEACRDVVTRDDAERIIAGRLDSHAWKTVRRFIDAAERGGRCRFLWLAGGIGTGKTVAAIGAIAEIGGRYMTMDEVRRGYAQETDEARDIRYRAQHCRLLVVDDVGAERDQAQGKFALHELVNARQSGRRLTILTGNLTSKQIRDRYDARTLDRLASPRGAIVDVRGASMRSNTEVK